MKKFFAGLAMAAMLVGTGVATTAPAAADSVTVRVGPTYHRPYYHRPYYRPVYHRAYYRPVYHRPVIAIGVGPYFYNGRHYQHRYWCSRHWCYR